MSVPRKLAPNPARNRRASDNTPSVDALNARRYIEWRDGHYYWRDHKAELDDQLDAQYAQSQRLKGATEK